MQLYSYSISLRIWHPSIEPSDITNNIGINPTRSFKAGQRRATPKGTLLDGTYRESYWSAYIFHDGEYSSADNLAEDIMYEAIKRLEPHKAFIHRLRSDGGRAHLQVSSFSCRNYAFEFSPEMLG